MTVQSRAALAAVLAGRIAPEPGLVLILSGRNVDPARFTAMIGA